MKTKNKKTNFAIFLVGIILLSQSIYAFGVSSPHWRPDNPLQLFPGQTHTVQLGLQNMVGDQDVTLRTSLLKGQEITQIEEKDYLVHAQTKDTEVPVTITIPKETAIGEEYEVRILFASVTADTGGTVTLGTEFETVFDVIVGEEPPQVQASPAQSFAAIAAILTMAIVIVVIVLLVIKRKKTNSAAKNLMQESRLN